MPVVWQALFTDYKTAANTKGAMFRAVKGR
jgi:hypothetical protein